MTLNEKLSFFHELVRCSYPMYLWNYDADFHLIDTTSPNRDIIADISFDGTLKKHLASGKRTPLILETRIGLVWIAGFSYQSDKLCGIHLLGPSFAGRDTHMILLKKLNTYDLSVKSRAVVTRIISETPVIPTNTLANYAVMLHYTLNNETILLNDVTYSLPDKKNEFTHPDQLPDEHNGIWMNEQKLCKMFEDGNPDFTEALSASFSISSGMKVDIGDALRKHKNNALVLLTLCSRSCIKGGLNPSVAYNLNDYYAQVLEECNTLGEVSKVCTDLTADYVSRVQMTKEASSISPQIQSSCYYIQEHLTEDLSIKGLADRIGYTEYYFSHKFKKETGLSVNEFFTNERIAKAKLLLSGTTKSIQDISDSLGFCNRSYFYSCFQKKEGISPSEYRRQHAKL